MTNRGKYDLFIRGILYQNLGLSHVQQPHDYFYIKPNTSIAVLMFSKYREIGIRVWLRTGNTAFVKGEGEIGGVLGM